MVVWTAFIAAMSSVGGLLALSDDAPAPRVGAGFAAMASTAPGPAMGTILDTSTPLDRERWTSIVIHDSRSPHGTIESLALEAQARDLQGLGYHFVIGNGNGLGDGDLHVGYRWNEQFPGAHVPGEAGREFNEHAVAICLIGNGDTREFTPRQMDRLAALVTALQTEFSIPRSRVLLSSEVAEGTTSPGRHFPRGEFFSMLPLTAFGG